MDTIDAIRGVRAEEATCHIWGGTDAFTNIPTLPVEIITVVEVPTQASPPVTIP